jgi:hypothetical protein
MANSIAAAPAALAAEVISGLVGQLALVNAFSTNLTGQFTRGKVVQVGLIGGDPAIEFGATGYHEAQDADITAVSVTLKHLHSTKAFNPITLAEYGEQYIVNAFVQNAVEELAAKCHAEIGAIITNANYSALKTVTAANFGYDDVIDINTDLSTAKASRQRALIVNPAYAGALRKDSTLVQPFTSAGASGSLVTSGSFGKVAGMDVFEYSDLPLNSENLRAFGCGKDAIAVASALPSAEMYVGEVDNAVDPSGLAVQVLKSKGTDGFLRLTATILFGAAKGRATSLVRVRDEAPA